MKTTVQTIFQFNFKTYLFIRNDFRDQSFFFFQCGQPIRRNTEKKSGLEKKAFHRLNQLIMPAELKIYFFSSCRDTTEDKRHFTLISGHLGLWRRKRNFPCKLCNGRNWRVMET